MKIALLFLTYGNLSQPKLWRKIIDNNKDKLNVYIHNKNDFIDNTYNLHEYCITNKVETEYGHKSLVEATLILFKEAYVDETNLFFILLSDKCIPLYNFDYIYKAIFTNNSNIILSNICPHFINAIKRYEKLTDKSFIDISEFRTDSQWLLLNRETVNFFINNNFLHLYSDSFSVVDEHYFGNICSKFNISYINKRITYVNWGEASDNVNDRIHPKTYELLTNEMVEKVLQSETFFLRKISEKCNLPSYFDNLS
jgi:hypothetical protein